MSNINSNYSTVMKVKANACQAKELAYEIKEIAYQMADAKEIRDVEFDRQTQRINKLFQSLEELYDLSCDATKIAYNLKLESKKEE